MEEFKEPTTCIIKHSNPCGIASGESLSAAIDRAIDSDPLSAFGGIVGLNRKCDQTTVEKLFKKLNFLEIVMAPDFEPKALEELQKKKNLRVLKMKWVSDPVKKTPQCKFTRIGVLVQEGETPIEIGAEQAKKTWKVVTEVKLKEEDWRELVFAWKCVKLVKSNAVVLTQNMATVGVGAGQMSRVDSVNIACQKAGTKTKGSYLASDAFFPMPDNIELAAKHGIRAIVQPGGSVKDADVIASCDQHKIAMVFTGERHFRH
jgi:phosphoribosylaminoimidazolecarboxamide formyltransferase/IMP cyclohydrolase